MKLQLARLTTIVLVGVAVASVQSPGRAQIPWLRFMGNNYSNGRSPNGGPPTTGTVTSAATVGNSVPSVAAAGGTTNGQVVVSGGTVGGYSYDLGTKLWDTSGTLFSSTYGTPTPYPPTISNENGVDVAYVTCGDTNSGGTNSLVALKLNPTKMPGKNYQELWSVKHTNTPANVPTISGAPVVGPDGPYNTVYCIDAHNISGSAVVWAFKNNGSNVGITKWSYSTPYPALLEQPILYVSGTTTYLVLVGRAQVAAGSGSTQLTIRVLVLRDDGNAAAPVGTFDFPAGDGQHGQQPEYLPNGAPSLSPDGTKLLIPWHWTNLIDTDYYGTACLSISVPTATASILWPAIPTNVNTPPSVYDVRNPASPTPYSIAIDAVAAPNQGVYYVMADGRTLVKRRISDGSLPWTPATRTLIGTGGQLPALDANDAAVWVASTSNNVGYVQRFPIDGSAATTWNVTDPVNSTYTHPGGITYIIGAGVAIGTNGATNGTQNNLYVTTTSTTGTKMLRKIR